MVKINGKMANFARIFESFKNKKLFKKNFQKCGQNLPFYHYGKFDTFFWALTFS